MASYRNFKDLVAGITSNEQFKNMVIQERSKKTDAKLREYAKELRRMINKNLSTYYKSYSPVEYDRTNKLKSSINTYSPIVNDGVNISAVLQFNDNAWHDNAVLNDPHESFVPALINYGWHLKNTTVTRNNRFRHFSGSFYITNAIDEFNAMYSKYGVFAKIDYDI